MSAAAPPGPLTPVELEAMALQTALDLQAMGCSCVFACIAAPPQPGDPTHLIANWRVHYQGAPLVAAAVGRELVEYLRGLIARLEAPPPLPPPPLYRLEDVSPQMREALVKTAEEIAAPPTEEPS